MKVKWKVDPKETGRYASFFKRNWPSAYYADGQYCAGIVCADDYSPHRARTGQHEPLKLTIRDYSKPELTNVTAKARYATLEEAKAALLPILEKHPHLIPKATS